MEEKPNHVEDCNEEVEGIDEVVEDSLSDELSDEDEEMEPEEDGSQLEAPLTEEEIEELIAELLEVESKAAEAQEGLEKESLEKVEREVRAELTESLQGDDLESAVAEEMETFKEEWEASLDELETESAHLLEQLDGAGVDLPSIYKWMESRAPNGCCTEAWKKRAHWVGSEITNDAVESIRDAEKDLQTLRPVRSKNGKILEEGASGYLGKKVVANDSSKDSIGNAEVDWSSFNKLFSQHPSKENISFGSERWASVYLASTPQQAAAMGLKFPGVDEVEEIDEIDDDPSDPFVADAIANEKELDLSEEQRKNYKKVKEEDDVIVDQKLQLQLKRRRRKQRNKKKAMRKSSDDGGFMEHGTQISAEEKCGSADGLTGEDLKAEVLDTNGFPADAVKEENSCNSNSSEPLIPQSLELRQGAKRLRDDKEEDNETKRCRTFVSDSDNEAQTLADTHDSGSHGAMIDKCNTQENGHQYMDTKFCCTACSKVTNDVHQHPLLKVIVCGECKCAVEGKMNVKDPDSSECYCAWCGGSNDLMNCRSCRNLFCISCVKRNVGVECTSEAKLHGWKCCRCSPELLQELTMELDKALGSQESTSSSSDSDTDNSDDDIGVSISSKKRKSKKIRRILDDTELGEETKRKIAMEKERQERLKSLKAQFSGISMMMNTSTCKGNLPEGASSEVLGDASNGYIVNVVREKGEDAVRIPPSISAKLKTHQVAGIRFMWENIIQSIRNVQAGDKGLGCILAHMMGVGKTFQVIAFLYSAMRSVDLGLRTALVVAPVNVLHNWRQEFEKWKPSEFKPLRVYMLNDRPRDQRAELLSKWKTKGGVFLISYTAFRNLSLGKHVKDCQTGREICSSLQEGPDILVCDEAHIIKNTRADTTQALKQVRCQRRIALTGSPLQNNLMEYYCMVDFVREGFLGSMHEFRNRFQNPIENGQHANCTAEDVRIMNQRSHILYEQLKGFVQRVGSNVAKKDLPPKTVFVIAVKLSSLQRKLYKKFLDVHGFNSHKSSCEGIKKQSFFAGYQVLAQICNHPWILQLVQERKNGKREDIVENFLPDASSSDENTDSNVLTGEKAKASQELSHRKTANNFFLEDWWNDLLNQNIHQDIDYSGKMVLLLDILTTCTQIGDKALVFSQSIPTLDLIEHYLSKLLQRGKKGKHWKRGKDWYRIDGKTECSERQKLVDAFNNSQNKRVKCTLISTRAGALGINLYSANRVIIFDGSWNPTYDLQAIFRAWRYGQVKPVYAYRLVAHGTMEEKIYKRQVQKEGLAARVVDRQQVHRSMSKEEILHLFDFDDDDMADKNGLANDTNISKKVGNLLKVSSDCPGSCSSDKLMDTLLGRHRQRWMMNYHEHETLLQENEEEKLTKEEQDLAWEVFRRSTEWQEVHRVPFNESTFEKEQNACPASAVLQRNTGPSSAEPQRETIPEPVINVRNRVPARKCTNISHLLTLRSQGIKVGCSTVCGECALEISWEELNRDSKPKE